MTAAELLSESFRDALKDYYYLLNRGYPEKTSLKLVGDRHRLSGNQRLCLLRGISSRTRAENRKSKQTVRLENRDLHIDGYNVVFTIMNYLLGKTTFIGNDGFLRDCGAVYGKIEDQEMFIRSAHLLLKTLAGIPARSITIHLDHTIENCENHLKIMKKKWNAPGPSLNLLLVKHADDRLKEIRNGVVATSDSQIIDAFPGKVADIARLTLTRAFKSPAADLGRMLKPKKRST